MKRIAKNKHLLMLASITVFLMGCNDAKYDVIDNMVYIKESKTQTYTSQKVSIRKADLPVFLTPCAGQIVPEDINVQVAVNENSLEAYNQRNGTSYVLLPKENYTIESESVTIKQGKQDADGVKIVFKPFTEEMEKSSSTYALPVNITTSGNMQTLKGADMILYVMDPLRKISVPVINRNNNLNMQMRQDYELNTWTVEFRLSIDELGMEIGQYNNQALFDAKSSEGEESGQIYTRFGDTTIEGNRLQIKSQGSQLNSNMLFNINTWYHIAYVDDGTKITLYVNGVKDGEMTTKGRMTKLGKDNFKFGNTGYLIANVKLSEMRFWTKALSATQIQNNMYNVNPNSDGLEAYWRMNEGEGNEFSDFTGHGNTCTSAGTTIWKHNIIADNKPDADVENLDN